jgi:hypothetical protein
MTVVYTDTIPTNNNPTHNTYNLYSLIVSSNTDKVSSIVRCNITMNGDRVIIAMIIVIVILLLLFLFDSVVIVEYKRVCFYHMKSVSRGGFVLFSEITLLTK